MKRNLRKGARAAHTPEQVQVANANSAALAHERRRQSGYIPLSIRRLLWPDDHEMLACPSLWTCTPVEYVMARTLLVYDSHVARAHWFARMLAAMEGLADERHRLIALMFLAMREGFSETCIDPDLRHWPGCLPRSGKYVPRDLQDADGVPVELELLPVPRK